MSPAEHVKHLRTRVLLLTQREFADKLGVDPMTVSRWERGKAEPSLLHIRRMTTIAKLPAAWFFEPLPEQEAVA